jgi:hydrogenase nickel incorporation protein HypA/HybF
MSLVDVACEEAARLDARVTALHLRIGVLSGVVADALNFSFAIATQGSAIEGTQLMIEPVPVTAWCPQCQMEQTIPSIQHLRCPTCHTPTPDIRHGTEMELFALEVEEHATAHC